jgi:hypothetical protein
MLFNEQPQGFTVILFNHLRWGDISSADLVGTNLRLERFPKIGAPNLHSWAVGGGEHDKQHSENWTKAPLFLRLCPNHQYF